MTDNNMKIRYIYRFLLLTVMMSAFMACSKDNDFKTEQGSAGGAILPMPDTLTMHPLGDSFQVLYTASDAWTFKLEFSNKDTEWLTVEPSDKSGLAGPITITVKADYNVDENRSCKIIFSSGGKNETMMIVQDKAVLEVTADEDSLNFDWRKDTLKLDVKSNIEWEIDLTDYDNSFSYDVERDQNDRLENNKEILVSTNNPNFGDHDMKAYIRLKPIKRDYSGKIVSNSADLSEKITLTQDFLYFLVEGSNEMPSLEPFSQFGSDYVGSDDSFSSEVTSQTIRVECEEEWELDKSSFADSWGLYVDKDFQYQYYKKEIGREVYVHDLTITLTKPNVEKAVRRDTLQLLLEGLIEGSERKIPVEQDAYEFDIAIGKETHLANNPAVGEGYKTIQLNTRGPWKLAAESDHSGWMEMLYNDSVVPFGEEVSGVGPAEFTVTVDEQNLSFDDLDVNLMFNTGIHENAEVCDTAKVIQDRFRFEFTEKAEDIGKPWSRLDMRSHNATLVSDGPWTLELQDVLGTGAEEWLDVNVVSADGTNVLDIENHTVKGEAGEWVLSLNANGTNNGTVDRIKSIRMTSDIHSQMGGTLPEKASMNFDVTQEKYRFDMVKDAGSIVNTTVEKPSYTSEGELVYEFRMECGAPWRITTCPDWVHFKCNEDECYEDASGEYRTIRMTVDHNVGSNWQRERSGQIVVRSYDGLDFSGAMLEEKKFTIWQDKFVFEVPNSTQTFNFDALPSSSKQIQINTLEDAGWELVDVPDWSGIMTSDKAGRGPRNITFRPSDYGLRTSRNSTLKVRSTVLENSPEIPIKISQEGYKFKFDDSSDYTSTLPAFDELKSKNTDPKTKNIVCDGTWTVYGIPDWLEVKSEGSVISNGASMNGNATLSFNANSTNTALESDNDRKNAQVTLSSEVNGYASLTLTLTVSQDPYVFNVSTNYKNPSDAVSVSQGAISVECSGDWSYATEGDVTVTEKKASSLSFKVPENYKLDPQDVKVTITSEHHKDGDKLEKTFTFTRPKYEFSVAAFKDKTADSEGETITISNLKCTGDLEAEILADADGKIPTWLEIVQQPTDGILKIEVDEYSGGKNAQTRKVQVVLRSEHYKHNEADLAKTITISQNPKSSK